MTAAEWRDPDPGTPVVFAGRLELDGIDAEVVTEPLPRSLRPRDPSHWVIADPIPFPFESLSERQWDVPIDVVTPRGIRFDTLVHLLGRAVLDRLTPLDTVVADDRLWAPLRSRFRLAETQRRRRIGSDSLTIRSLLDGARVAGDLGRRLPEGGDISGGHRAVMVWEARTTHTKARYRAEAARVAAALGAAIDATPARGSVIEFSDAAVGLLPVALRTGAVVTAVRSDPALAAHLGIAFPEVPLRSGASGDLGLPTESTDIACGVVQRLGEPSQGVLRQVWRSLRIGGTLIVAARAGTGGYGLHDLNRLVLDAADGNAILPRPETLRDPHTGRSTSVLVSYTKIGVPTTW